MRKRSDLWEIPIIKVKTQDLQQFEDHKLFFESFRKSLSFQLFTFFFTSFYAEAFHFVVASHKEGLHGKLCNQLRELPSKLVEPWNLIKWESFWLLMDWISSDGVQLHKIDVFSFHEISSLSKHKKLEIWNEKEKKFSKKHLKFTDTRKRRKKFKVGFVGNSIYGTFWTTFLLDLL